MSTTRHERLRRHPDVRAVLRRGRRCARPTLVLHVRDRDDRGPARVAVVASRRVGGAVERNRAKRVLRAAAASVVLPPGVDVAIVARAATPAASSTTARAELREAVERLFDQPTGDGFPGRTTDRDAVEVTS